MSAEPPYIAFYYAATKGKEISIQWDPGDDWFRKSDEGWTIYQLTSRNSALVASVGAHTKADENVLMERQVIMVDGQEVVVFHTVKNPQAAAMRMYRLKELIEALTEMQNSPVHPDVVQTGMGQVFVYVRSRDDPTKILIVRGELELKDMGSYLEIGILR